MHRRRFGQEPYRAFCAVIGRRSRRSDEAEDRGDIDDRAPAALAYRGHRSLHPQPDALLVHVDDRVPFLLRGLLQTLPVGDASVVNENVESAELAHAGLHSAVPVSRAGYVQMNRANRDGAELSVDRVGSLLRQFVAHVADYDLRAFACEEPRLRGPLPTRATGDQCNFILEPFHL